MAIMSRMATSSSDFGGFHLSFSPRFVMAESKRRRHTTPATKHKMVRLDELPAEALVDPASTERIAAP
jgi:hypothetical protein